MGEVGGEAVAEIDAGGGEAAAKKGLADGEARLGEEMRVVVGGACSSEFAWGGGEGGELGCGPAEGASGVEEIAGSRSGTAKGAARGRGAEENDVGEDGFAGRLRCVTAGERDVVFGGQGKKAVEEAVEPAGLAGLRISAWRATGRRRGVWLPWRRDR